MTADWEAIETTVHQDHVIAHVIGATVVGYFVFDEALYVLLDIGFVWTIFIDGEMALLPHPVAVNEIELSNEIREKVKADIDRLLGDNLLESKLEYMSPPPAECQIKEVAFFGRGDQRRLLLIGEKSNLAVETSLVTAEIQVHEF